MYAENCIRERSKKAEGRWCTDKWQASPAGKEYFMFDNYFINTKIHTEDI